MMKLVVVGNGMGSVRLLEHLVAGSSDYEIVVLSDESGPGYNRILLSKLLAGSVGADAILLQSQAWYQQHNIQLLSGSDYRAVNIDRQLKWVRTAGGQCFDYDRLVLATGSTPVAISVNGSELNGIQSFRRMEDVESMLVAARCKQARAVVIGGGLLGLECASGLARQGMQVTVVDNSSTLLTRQLDGTAGAMLKTELESRGITFRSGASLQQYAGSHGRVQQVEIINEYGQQERLKASLVVVAAGVRPNIELMRDAGMECDRGVLVNRFMQTSDPAVFAFGECVQLQDNLFGLVAPVYEQARVVSEQLLNHATDGFKPVPIPTSLKIDGIDLFSSGEFIASDDDEVLLVDAREYGIYRKIVINNNRIKGVLLYGDVTDGLWYQELMLNKADISSFRQRLLFGKRFQSAA